MVIIACVISLIKIRQLASNSVMFGINGTMIEIGFCLSRLLVIKLWKTTDVSTYSNASTSIVRNL
jgi:hypothetical protein